MRITVHRHLGCGVLLVVLAAHGCSRDGAKTTPQTDWAFLSSIVKAAYRFHPEE